MSSRRMMTRSHSGEARSSYYNGDDVSGSSRPAGRSYLSNVRPENSCTSHRYSQYRPTRSTLCSVMAQLTEDIQPCFETTLKSKAVSETCNVKFTCVVTGYPTPEVIWYKDDVQLDRYCGLPKYEIFRNGQNHSLHIYDCTTEDAAIYQASASNSKGIVSCSGVLEVGVMSEYKIHQRYFAKLKQKAENKRRELEGKDNQGPGKKEQLRTISPDRSQRKRRSPMEGSLSTPSSIEDEGIEESQQSPPAEARLQETTVGEMEDKPVSLTNGAVSPITNGKVVSENGSKGITYIFDSVQKIFTAHQPKTPFAKKKIKISNGEKSEKTDSSAERMSEERRANEEPRVPPAPRDLLRSQGPLEEVMEIESTADSVKKTEQCQKMATEKAPPVNKIASEGEKVCVEGNKGVSSQKKRPTLPISPATVSPAARPSANHTVSGSQSEQVAELEKEVGNSDIEENLDLRRPGSPVTSMQTSPVATPQQPLSNAVKGDITKTQQEDVTVMEVNKKPTAAETRRQPVKPVTLEGLNTAEDSATVCPEHSDISVPIPHGTSETRGPGSADKACKREDAFLQRPRRESRDQLSEQETSPSLKNASVSGPRPRGEVTQAHTQTNRNDAPVDLEPLPTQHEMDARPPHRAPSGRGAMTDDSQTLTSHSPRRAASDKMTQGALDHSRGSSESHTALFADLQKSPLESPGHGENTSGCTVSPSDQRSQVEIAMKTVEGTEMQVDEKTAGNEVGGLRLRGDNLALSEGNVEMETEDVSVKATERAKIERTVEKEVTDVAVADESNSEIKSEFVLKGVSENRLESPNVETLIPHITENPENTSTQNTNISEKQIEGFKEIPTPVSKILSIAEMLWSQLKALDSTVSRSVTATLPTATDNVPFPTTAEIQIATEKCPELRMDCREFKTEAEGTKLDRKLETSADATSASNVEARHFEINHGLTKAEQEAIQPLNATSPTVEALQKPFVIPPICVIDTGSNLETGKLSGSTEKENDSVMDTGQECAASAPVASKDGPDVSLSSAEIVQTDFSLITSKELTNKVRPSSNPSAIMAPDHRKPLANAFVEMDSELSPSTKASSQETLMSTLEPDDSTDLVFTQHLTPEIKPVNETDQHKEHKPTMSGLQTIQGITTKSVLATETQEIHLPLIQQESSLSTVEELSKTDSSTPLPNSEANLSSRARNNTSPIPSATPQELASGARRKIFTPKPKTEDNEVTLLADDQPHKEEGSTKSSKFSPGPVTLSVSPSLSRRSPLVQSSGQRTPPAEGRSPQFSRRKMPQETPAPNQEATQQVHTPKTEEKPAEKDKHNPFKAPQVIRKIRGESFSDTSGHLKLWCQFFNVLSDSTIKWYRDEVEIAEFKRSAGDETQVNLAIVQASSRDCGVYGCTITNEYGTDSTDLLLSVDILAGMSLREDLGVGEEIEMTPLLLNKGLADSGVWGSKFFGRIMMQESHIGERCSHKAWRAKVIYGLEPVFESGTTCIIKVRNPLTYGGKGESQLTERNLDLTQQECRIQNLAREYCKIFSAEARVIENFGTSLEIIPVYLMYRPANTIPHATVEADLKGAYLKYSRLDDTGRLVMRTGSDVEQKCCALQHWIHQWTSGNLLLTRLEGVDTKITNVGISVKSTGYQGLPATGNLKVFEQFVAQHQCNYYCGLLSLRSLKAMDSLQTPSKPKGSRSPLLQRKMAAGSSSPQTSRKGAGSPRLPKKSESEQDSSKAPANQKNTTKVVNTR